jgi:HSP20 family molecular chaperone IbpA
MNTQLRKNNIQPLMRNDGLEERLNSLFPRWLTDFFEQDFATLDNRKQGYNIIRSEDGNQYKMQIDVAGYDKDDLNVLISEKSPQRYLVVKGEHRERLEEGEEYVQQNIQMSNFELTYPIRKDFDLSECKVENGMLNITFKRNSEIEEENLKKIEIQS